MLNKVYYSGYKTLLQKDYNIAKFVAQLGIVTRDEYRKFRKQHLQLRKRLPCQATITRIFGNWTRFSYQIMKYNTDLILTNYVKKSASEGKWLKISECDKLKIPIRKVMDILRPSLFNELCYRKLSLMKKKI